MTNLFSRRTAAGLLAAAALGMTTAAGPAAAQAAKTVVLVHGAFSDGSVWGKVIPLLQAKGLKVVAVQNPLPSLEDDLAATKRALANVSGPVVLVGHSLAGSVITEAGNDPKVASLVYVTAVAPEDGESASDIFAKYKTPGLGEIKADAAGFLTMSHDGLSKYLIPGLPAAVYDVIEATQTPTAAKELGAKISHAAWKTKPSWYVLTSDDMILAPEAQKMMAERIKAKVVTVATGHMVILTKPEDVAGAIVDAAAGKPASH